MCVKRALFLACSLLSACGQPTTSSLDSSRGMERGRAAYPVAPDPGLTPGNVCRQPDAYRYPERIAYCTRDVSSDTKKAVIDQYDARLGFRIGRMNRADFKIDHFIPLCAGGGNGPENLWPQHHSIYPHTDLLEQRVCELMACGRLRQVDAIATVKHVKFNLQEARAVLDDVTRRLQGCQH